MAERGYYTVDGRGPDGSPCEFKVAIEFLQHLQRHGPTQKFYDSLLLKDALSDPHRIFLG